NWSKARAGQKYGQIYCFSFSLLAQSNQDCCLSYTKKPLPRRAIIGFSEQLSSEVCDINAIIFLTRNGMRACANPKEHWVKKQLQWLR
ncbi:hypothetical protein JD844_007320, partial [Phrynosoma platyrhinos]